MTVYQTLTMRHRHLVRLVTESHTVIEIQDSYDPSIIHTLKLSNDGYYQWMKGVHVQTAFPTMSTDQREILVTGLGPKSWDTIMGAGE